MEMFAIFNCLLYVVIVLGNQDRSSIAGTIFYGASKKTYISNILNRKLILMIFSISDNDRIETIPLRPLLTVRKDKVSGTSITVMDVRSTFPANSELLDMQIRTIDNDLNLKIIKIEICYEDMAHGISYYIYPLTSAYLTPYTPIFINFLTLNNHEFRRYAISQDKLKHINVLTIPISIQMSPCLSNRNGNGLTQDICFQDKWHQMIGCFKSGKDEHIPIKSNDIVRFYLPFYHNWLSEFYVQKIAFQFTPTNYTDHIIDQICLHLRKNVSVIYFGNLFRDTINQQSKVYPLKFSVDLLSNPNVMEEPLANSKHALPSSDDRQQLNESVTEILPNVGIYINRTIFKIVKKKLGESHFVVKRTIYKEKKKSVKLIICVTIAAIVCIGLYLIGDNYTKSADEKLRLVIRKIFHKILKKKGGKRSKESSHEHTHNLANTGNEMIHS
ncbi:hypothetical protein SNEBB_009106 [Seison nebaliae]|nr:hypothetical protein SNEBB_009106 [Seison nebaliae]